MPSLFKTMQSALSTSSIAEQLGGKKKKKKIPSKGGKTKVLRKMKLRRMRGGDMMLTDEITNTTYKCIKQDSNIGEVGAEMTDKEATADITANLLDELKASETTGDEIDTQSGGGKKKN